MVALAGERPDVPARELDQHDLGAKFIALEIGACLDHRKRLASGESCGSERRTRRARSRTLGLWAACVGVVQNHRPTTAAAATLRVTFMEAPNV